MNSKKLGNEGEDDPFYNIMEAIDDLTPEKFGWLSGPAFTVIYAVLTLFTGPLSDNVNRTKMICFSCISWSLMTYGSSVST